MWTFVLASGSMVNWQTARIAHQGTAPRLLHADCIRLRGAIGREATYRGRTWMNRKVRLALMSWLFVTGAGLAARDARATCSVPTDCVQALSPICHLGLCAPCLTDHGTGTPLDCPNATEPVCQLSGGIGGSCTECSASETGLCDATRPVCLSDGTCGCTMTSDCTAGHICDTGAHACVPVVVDAGSGDGGSGADGGSSGGAGDGGSSGQGSGDGGSGGDGGSSSGAGTGDGGGSGADGSAGDGSTTDGSTEDGSTEDGSTDDSGSAGDEAPGDGAASTDATTGVDDSGADGGEAANDHAYIGGGGCACTSGPGDTRNGLAALGVVALAGVAFSRRRR
jgi:MYXO-CTERM domain-containing protein